jgi:hypothetical protein
VFEIPADLHPACVPLAFLLGAWEGEGVVEYPTVQRRLFGQRIEFGHTGKPFLTYSSRTWAIEEEGSRPLAMETGFWRPQPDNELEVVMAHPTGFVETWTGEIRGPRIEIRTDAVIRMPSAKEYTAGHRLYGLVNGQLMWAYEMAAMGLPLQPHVSAALDRAPALA